MNPPEIERPLPNLTIRPATADDDDAIWAILDPTFRAGETYPVPRDISRADALAYWRSPGHSVFVAQDDDKDTGKDEAKIVGTYYLRANQRGGGAHVANCGYMTAQEAAGRGIARTMCMHSLDEARRLGFTAMQFNFVVATNERAVRLWQACGFTIVGRLPKAFRHPRLGLTDALVMMRAL
ncbi:MAG: Histone acetyltransferase [Bradyrhizobium sp.]|nr:Histone acetyltransferase [Bradyrhizobium sp.]